MFDPFYVLPKSPFSNVDNADAVKVGYTHGETSKVLVIKFAEGQITDVKTYER